MQKKWECGDLRTRFVMWKDMAIGMEDEAVSYYTYLAAGKMGFNAAVLNLIVDEEKRHVNLIRGHRQRLFPQG